jgi:LmbE family N-acetylglucosaminyl deacetylase
MTTRVPAFLKTLFRRKRNLFLLIATVCIIALGFIFYYLIYPQVLPQQAIDLFDDVTPPVSGQKILVFAPHPDDETIAVGGYIACARKTGADVRIVLITDGNKHRKEDIRYAEFRKATGILGVPENNLVFLGYPDGGLHKQKEAILSQSFKKQIDDYHPDVIIYPHQKDYHLDHSTAGKIISRMLEEEESEKIAYQYLVHYEFIYPRPRRFDPDLYLLPPVRLLGFGETWQRFILSEDILELKMKALLTYKSQINDIILKDLFLSSIRKNELLALFSR